MYDMKWGQKTVKFEEKNYNPPPPQPISYSEILF